MMQTFLPYPSFEQSASVLDGKRLNKQRIECLQIYNALTNPNYGWQNHPAVNMWRHAVPLLTDYWYAIELECSKRGFKKLSVPFAEQTGHVPKWLGLDEFHLSHRLNLLYKFPEHYALLFREKVPTTKPDYFWPTKEGY